MQSIDKIARVFDTVASGYNNEPLRYFAFAAERMVETLRPQRGWQLLDICTGTGHAALAAAQLIVPDGRVQAIDVSANMLDVALERFRHAHLDNIDLHEMDAMQLEFRKDDFDAAMCGFGLFFMPDMHAALLHWQTVLKPAAPLIFSSFGARAFSPYLEDFMQRAGDAGAEVAEELPWPASEAACTTLLEQAGYTDVRAANHNFGYQLRNVDEWWEIICNTAMRGMLMQLPADRLADLRASHLEFVATQAGDEGLWLEVPVIFALGYSPAS